MMISNNINVRDINIHNIGICNISIRNINIHNIDICNIHIRNIIIMYNIIII